MRLDPSRIHLKVLLIALFTCFTQLCEGFCGFPIKHETTSTIIMKSHKSQFSRFPRLPLWIGRSEKPLTSGIRTAQLLLDPRRHPVLISEISAKFPFVPESALQNMVALVGETLQKIAPDEIQKVFTPGGLKDVRPEIRKTVVQAALENDGIRSLPLLTSKDKGQILGSLVDMALDELLKDAEWVLSPPEKRLEILEFEVQAVRQELGWYRLFKYRVRRRPFLFVGSTLSVGMGLLLAYTGGSIPEAMALLSGVGRWSSHAFQSFSGRLEVFGRSLISFARALSSK